tara:strand:- start:26717 stop:28279 length:1563 start_codon:yes stop_codon:yes gene_type:complete
MQPTPLPGKLAQLLNAENEHYATVLEIESIFNIDTVFPATRNLAEALLELLANIYPSNRQADWHTALLAINAIGIVQSWRLAPKTGSDQNPLNQRFGSYPLAAYLLQESSNMIQNQTLGIKLLFLYVLLQRHPDSHGLTNHADTLRLATRRNSKELKLLQALPLYTDDFHDYHQQLKSAVKSQLHISFSSPLLNSLRSLLEMAPNRVPAKPTTIPTSQITVVKPPTDLSSTQTLDDTPHAGTVIRIRSDSGDPRLAEPPEYIDYFEADLHPENNGDDYEATSPQLFDEFSTDFQAKTSEYWLRRHHRLSANDWSHLTRIEKKRVASFIADGLRSSDEQVKITAGLIGTMYVTGMTLVELLQASTGPNQIFSAIGSYIRDVRKPENGFTPSDIQRADLQPTAGRLLLRLPAPIAEWVGQLCQRGQPTLGQCLDVDLDTATSWVKGGIETLRDNGRFFRIRLERIPAALALETTLRFRDPVITYLLTARENQAAPKLSYYVSCPIDELINAYNLIISEMLYP